MGVGSVATVGSCKHILKVSICLLLLALVSYAQPAQAVVLLISDFDNTVTKDREDGSWVTYYELFRVQNTAHSAIRTPEELPRSIFLSHADLEKVEHMLSRGEGHTGHLERIKLASSVRKNGEPLESIIPGFYTIIDPMTYRFYIGEEYFDPDVQSPTNYWLNDLRSARFKSKAGQGTLWGPGYETVKHFLSHPALAAGFRLATARGYPDKATEEVFRDMQDNGEINILPFRNPNGQPLSYWTLSHPQFANRWGHSVTLKKHGLIESLANQYRMKAPQEKVLNPDGTRPDYYHTFIIQEDHPKHMDAILELARDIARRHQHKIKFVLRHAGDEESRIANNFYINVQGKNQLATDVVVTGDGSLRAARTEEIFIPASIAEVANASLLNSCRRLLESRNLENKEQN